MDMHNGSHVTGRQSCCLNVLQKHYAVMFLNHVALSKG